jgi:hypothetical protein
MTHFESRSLKTAHNGTHDCVRGFGDQHRRHTPLAFAMASRRLYNGEITDGSLSTTRENFLKSLITSSNEHAGRLSSFENELTGSRPFLQRDLR